MLRNRDEDAGRKRHVEDPVTLLPAVLQLLQVFPQVHKRLVLIVLTRDVRTRLAELLELIFHIRSRNLDIGLDSFEVLFTIHLRPRISDNLHIFGQEAVSMLYAYQLYWYDKAPQRPGTLTRPKSAGNCIPVGLAIDIEADVLLVLTVFFLAKSPDAPSTTITVFSLSSMMLWTVYPRLANRCSLLNNDCFLALRMKCDREPGKRGKVRNHRARSRDVAEDEHAQLTRHCPHRQRVVKCPAS